MTTTALDRVSALYKIEKKIGALRQAILTPPDSPDAQVLTALDEAIMDLRMQRDTIQPDAHRIVMVEAADLRTGDVIVNFGYVNRVQPTSNGSAFVAAQVNYLTWSLATGQMEQRQETLIFHGADEVMVTARDMSQKG